MPDTYLIHNAKVITCDIEGTVAEAVAVRGNKIEAVGPEHFLLSDYKDAQILDARGRAVMPGMIDGHSHLDRETTSPVVPMRGWSALTANRHPDL